MSLQWINPNRSGDIKYEQDLPCAYRQIQIIM